jgi:galactonate dehydratase
MRCTVPVPIPSDLATFKIPTPLASCFRTFRSLAEAHEVNVAPHNFYGHLCTMMNAHFAAAVPNLRIMEIDIDRLAWDDELVTQPPQIEAGHLIVPDRPGWGTEPNEDGLAAHPPKPYGGLDFRKKS